MFTSFNEIKDALMKVTEEPKYKEIEIGMGPEYTVRVIQYLPIDGKSNLVQYVVNAAIDNNTGCFSPVRVNVYYAIGVMRAYCGVHFDDDQNVAEAYDLLESTGILDRVMEAIPEGERNYMENLINDTIEDIARYNSSLVGMLNAMNQDATGLDESLKKILEQVKNREGLEILEEIKNVGGTD